MSNGFVKLRRTNETQDLLKDPFAFLLLTVIGIRARRTDALSVADLWARQAFIGDSRGLGLTRQQYRGAQRRLKRWRLADFTPTNRGTIATLLDSSVYDINETPEQPPPNHQATHEEPSGNQRKTIKEPSDNHRPTTNKSEKKEKKYSCHSDELRLSKLLLSLILERKPDFRRPDLQRWAVQVDRMIRLDGRTPERIEAVIRWCQRDPFWRNNILSTAKLRKHFDRRELEMGRDTPTESIRERVAHLEREGKLSCNTGNGCASLRRS